MEGPAIQRRNIVLKIISFSWLSKTSIIEAISFLFVTLFLYTGISKLLEYSTFKEQIAESPILQPAAPFIAWILPLSEFIVTILLIIPRWRLKGLYTSLILMVSFTIYIIAIMTFNKELPCSCGGIISLLSWQGHLVFNSAFVLLAIIGIMMQKRMKQSIQDQLTNFLQTDPS